MDQFEIIMRVFIGKINILAISITLVNPCDTHLKELIWCPKTKLFQNLP
jgi:hypothetical protein